MKSSFQKTPRTLRWLLIAAALWLAIIMLLSAQFGLTKAEAAVVTALYLCAWGAICAFLRRERAHGRAARLALAALGTLLSGALWLGLLFCMGGMGMIDERGALLMSGLFWTAWGAALAIRRAVRRRSGMDGEALNTQGADARDEQSADMRESAMDVRRCDDTARLPRTAQRVRKRRIPRWAAIAAGAAAVVLLTAGVRRAARPVEIPEALEAFAEKYPEAAGFVNDYPAHYRDHPSKDVSGEVKKGVVPLFIQWDERWGYEDYGGNYLAVNGCGPTCLSMVVCGLTGETDANPYAVACYSEEQGYYTPGSGTSWALMTQGAAHYGLRAEKGSVSADYITGALKGGDVLIASMKPGDFTYTGHFIVLTGLDADGKVRVNDSNSRVNSAKSWDVQTLVDQMKGVWRYSYDG